MSIRFVTSPSPLHRPRQAIFGPELTSRSKSLLLLRQSLPQRFHLSQSRLPKLDQFLGLVRGVESFEGAEDPTDTVVVRDHLLDLLLLLDVGFLLAFVVVRDEVGNDGRLLKLGDGV